MSIIRSIIVILLLVAPGLCWGQEAPSMRWSVKPSRSHFKRGEPVTLLYSLRNGSEVKKLVAASPAIQEEISLELVGPDGKKIPWQGAVYSSRSPGIVGLVLLFPSREASGTTSVPLSCNPMGQGGFCLDKAGRYTATAVYRTSTFGMTDCKGLVAAGPYRSELFEFWVD